MTEGKVTLHGQLASKLFVCAEKPLFSAGSYSYLLAAMWGGLRDSQARREIELLCPSNDPSIKNGWGYGKTLPTEWLFDNNDLGMMQLCPWNDFSILMVWV